MRAHAASARPASKSCSANVNETPIAKRWYPSGVLFDDVPKALRGLVNVTSPPYDRHAGYAPALTDDEIDAIVAFLGTLTDAAYAQAAKR